MTTDQTIIELIQTHAIGNQSELRERLRAQGIDLTQPTLSRHLKRLSIAKHDGFYRRVERAALATPDYTLSIAPPNMLVFRTRPGHAQVLAVALDDCQIDGIVGTLAGDDSVFVATHTHDINSLAQQIRATLPPH